MNSIETICNSIIESAQKERENILSEAKLNAKQKLQSVQKDIDEATKKTQKEVEDRYNDEIESAKNSAKSAINKLLLKQKQQALKDIFDGVTDALCHLERYKYEKLVENLLIEYAKEGDGISLSADTILDEKFLTSLKVFKERKLKFMYHKSEIKGGFVLFNSQSDTIVSFESLVDEYREKYSYKIIKKLFD